jgi:hypothetical protein
VPNDAMGDRQVYVDVTYEHENKTNSANYLKHADIVTDIVKAP